MKEDAARVRRLERQMQLLKQKELSIVKNEIKNIEEIELDELLENVDPGSIPFNLASEQLEFPYSVGSAYPFLSFKIPDSEGIVAEGSSSS